MISYDIHDNKLRTQFSKFLGQYGQRVQYSVFEVHHSARLLELIKIGIESQFAKRFTQSDSVLIYKLSQSCEKISYGYAKNQDQDFVVLD